MPAHQRQFDFGDYRPFIHKGIHIWPLTRTSWVIVEGAQVTHHADGLDDQIFNLEKPLTPAGLTELLAILGIIPELNNRVEFYLVAAKALLHHSRPRKDRK